MLQRLKSFFGWSFAAFFALLLFGSLFSNAIVGAFICAIWVLICLPPFNRLVLGLGVRHWVWWKIGIFMVGLILIGSTTPSTPTAQVQPSPAVVASPTEPVPTAPEISPSPLRRSAQVVSIGDGDTLQVQLDNQPITVRLACIDAPESAQPQGRATTDRLKELLPKDSATELRPVDTDRYGRMVAELYRDGRSVNLQLVQEGHAVVYTQYLEGCATTREQYLKAEAAAKSRKLAFWSQSEPILPWDWRDGVRPSPPPSLSPVASPPLKSSPSPIASPPPEPVDPPPAAVATGPVREPISGRCECPYDTDRAGRRCGGRSAYSKPGGSSPVCYLND